MGLAGGDAVGPAAFRRGRGGSVHGGGGGARRYPDRRYPYPYPGPDRRGGAVRFSSRAGDVDVYAAGDGSPAGRSGALDGCGSRPSSWKHGWGGGWGLDFLADATDTNSKNEGIKFVLV